MSKNIAIPTREGFSFVAELAAMSLERLKRQVPHLVIITQKQEGDPKKTG